MPLCQAFGYTRLLKWCQRKAGIVFFVAVQDLEAPIRLLFQRVLRCYHASIHKCTKSACAWHLYSRNKMSHRERKSRVCSEIELDLGRRIYLCIIFLQPSPIASRGQEFQALPRLVPFLLLLFCHNVKRVSNCSCSTHCGFDEARRSEGRRKQRHVRSVMQQHYWQPESAAVA